MNVFEYRSVIPARAADVFRWHERPEALTDLLPQTRWVRIDHRAGGISDGGEVALSIGAGSLRIPWIARHFGFEPGRQFCDEQVRGPFRVWRHTHRVIPIAQELTLYEDHVEYAVPGGPVVNFLLEPLIWLALNRAFAERHRIVRTATTPQPAAGSVATAGTERPAWTWPF